MNIQKIAIITGSSIGVLILLLVIGSILVYRRNTNRERYLLHKRFLKDSIIHLVCNEVAREYQGKNLVAENQQEILSRITKEIDKQLKDYNIELSKEEKELLYNITLGMLYLTTVPKSQEHRNTFCR